MPTQKSDRSTHAARVAQIAGELIAEHGSWAVHAAIERLNDAIDRGDRISRDFYAEIVCTIIEQDRGAQWFAESHDCAKFLIGAKAPGLRGKLPLKRLYNRVINLARSVRLS